MAGRGNCQHGVYAHMHNTMTDLSLEALREQLEPINRALDVLQQDVRALRNETTAIRREQHEMRGDLDKLIALVRRLRDDAEVTGGVLVRLERRLERLEEEQAK
jgi:chromosome segregation ATPase